MTMLWTYDDYVKCLSHENHLVRVWSLTALSGRYENRYTEEAAALLHDENDDLARMAIRYLGVQEAVSHADAILSRILNTKNVRMTIQGIRVLAHFRYAKAADSLYKNIIEFNEADDMDEMLAEYMGAMIEYSANVHTERGRRWLLEDVEEMSADSYYEPAISALLSYHRVEDIELVMDRLLDFSEENDGHAELIEAMLAPARANTYFRAFISISADENREFIRHDIQDWLIRIRLPYIEEEIVEEMVSSLDDDRHDAYLAIVKNAIEKMTAERYPAGSLPEPLEELAAADRMCRDLIACLEARPEKWPAMAPKGESFNFIVPLLFALLCAVTERGLYASALWPHDDDWQEADDDLLESAFIFAGPGLPKSLLDKLIADLPPRTLMLQTPMTPTGWTYFWGLRIMRRRGDRCYARLLMDMFDFYHHDEEDIILREASVYDELIGAIRVMDESADEIIMNRAAQMNLCPDDMFNVLKYMPYAAAHDLAVSAWEDDPKMLYFDGFVHCLFSIGDARAIPKLKELNSVDPLCSPIISSLEFLSDLYQVAVPELAKMRRNYDILFEELMKLGNSPREAMERLLQIEEEGDEDAQHGRPAVSPAPLAQPKIGRNETCPCGSGKKYKKCCLIRK